MYACKIPKEIVLDSQCGYESKLFIYIKILKRKLVKICINFTLYVNKLAFFRIIEFDAQNRNPLKFSLFLSLATVSVSLRELYLLRTLSTTIYIKTVITIWMI